MNDSPMHDALKSLSWLEGTWTTRLHGEGKFPTVKPFVYCEEIKFISIGQAAFNYEAQSWHPDKKCPMHREVGFFKCIPNSDKVALVLAHNFGVTTIEEGFVRDKEIKLQSTSVSRISRGCKEPAVTKINREFRLMSDDTLEQIVSMSTSRTLIPTEHLRARYVKLLSQE